ncbi:MAG: hypothetical protein KC619_25520, partial [Myxococcales bacterium]|nr:hypothetical protein [Myxococcales bacterium]
MRRLSRIQPWLWGLAFGCIVFAQALYDWEKAGWGDWGQFHHWWEVGRISIWRWHEWPLFDPHHCGGVSMWGQPQSQHNAPTWWITGLIFGTVAGHKLFILLHGVIGFVGMYKLGRRMFGMREVAAALAAVTFAYSGFFAWRAAGGHSTFLAFNYLPLLYFCWRKTNEDLRYAGGVAGLMALTLLEGGTYPFPLMFLTLAFDFVAQLVPPKPQWRVIRTGLITGTLTLAMGAIRLWPVYLTMSRFPRNTRMEDQQTWEEVLHSITARAPHDWTWGHRWVWAEYSAHVGWGIVGLSLLGALFALKKRGARHLVFGALVFALCAMGNAGPWYPWPLLHELPVFENFHVPSRFHVLLIFYLCLLAGLAVERVFGAWTRRTKRRWTRAAIMSLAWFLFLASGAEVVSNSAIIAGRWDGSPIVGVPEPRFHLVSPVGYLEQYMNYPMRNVGTRACYDPVPWDISPGLWQGDIPQARLVPPTAGEVTDWGRTNHTLFAEVHLGEPARVIFNQNFDPDWHLSVDQAPGTPTEDMVRLAVELPAGDHRIEARFEPADLPWSVLTSLGAGLVALL